MGKSFRPSLLYQERPLRRPGSACLWTMRAALRRRQTNADADRFDWQSAASRVSSMRIRIHFNASSAAGQSRELSVERISGRGATRCTRLPPSYRRRMSTT